MNPAGGALLSLAYILGLLVAASLGLPTNAVSWQESGAAIAGFCVLGIVAAIALPRLWRTGPRWGLWVAVGIVAALAIAYFQFKVPQPTSNDISQFVATKSSRVQGQVVTVQGKVESLPRLTRNQHMAFWLQATQLNEVESSNNTGARSEGVTGKLYVTVPLLQATGLYPGQTIAVTGILYKPKPPSNPGAFDFGAYLAKEGAFAGLRGRQVNGADEQQKSPWRLWVLRQRIIRSQMRWLQSPAGQVVSSFVLGNRAVDIPFDIRDQFVRAGLAHALAASGTQTSLILGVVLVLIRRYGVKTQLGFGSSALVIYVCLTGLQPSVLRAAIMGFGALVALVTQRKVKPLGSLLVAATLLLVFNPLWISDLGFQLSFLATLGLLVTVPPLIERLDWLPPAVASLIAIPLAAALWTLPLQLYVFGIVAPYSIAANIISVPLIAIISIGSIISALAALFSPLAGSGVAWLLYYPTQAMIAVVQFLNALPGSSVAVGTINLLQLLLLYGLIGICCLSPRLQRRWWLVGLVAVSLVVLPVWEAKASQFQVTVLATNREQVLVIQDQGQVVLINSGEADTASFTVLPFLQKQGVNQIDWAVTLDNEPRFRSGWLQLLASLPVKTFYDNAQLQRSPDDTPARDTAASNSKIASVIQSQKGNYQRLAAGQTISLGSIPLELINAEPPVLQLQIHDETWLLLGEVKPDMLQELVTRDRLDRVQVLLWSGEPLTPELLDTLQPKVAIASSNTVDSGTMQLLQNNNVLLYWTGRDGAIQWIPEKGFETTLEASNNDASLL